MKKLVWSETRVQGGQPFAGALHEASDHQRTVPERPRGRPLPTGPRALPELYRDVAVVAYRVPASDQPQADLRPVATSNGGAVDASLLADGDLVRDGHPARAARRTEGLDPVRVRSTAGDPRRDARDGRREAAVVAPRPRAPSSRRATTAHSFRTIAEVPRSVADQNTVAFEPVRARFFRLAFPATPPARIEVAGIELAPPAPPGVLVAELVLHTGARVNRFEEKAAFATLGVLSEVPTPTVAPDDAVKKGDVVDLTTKMRPDGTLDWAPPAGRWTVLRMGHYAARPARNAPASPEAHRARGGQAQCRRTSRRT